MQQQYDSLGLELGLKTGSYSDISPFTENVTARMLTLYINHGRGPYMLDYNYMIVPNVSLESMPGLIQKYDEEQVFACMSTNNLFHGTMWPALKRAAFVLWTNMTTTFTCKSPTFNLTATLPFAGAYLYSETERNFTLTASNPRSYIGSLNVTVDRVGYGKGCTTTSNINASTNTTVTLMLPTAKNLQGASISVTCKKENTNES